VLMTAGFLLHDVHCIMHDYLCRSQGKLSQPLASSHLLNQRSSLRRGAAEGGHRGRVCWQQRGCVQLPC
jgi:hypothetical protein